jgi:cell division protein ZapA (FtsZ GTPase activity inhibitor)
MSSATRPKPRRIAASFSRSIITTILLVMLAIMVMRDILARRFSSDRQPQSDVTQRSH